MIEPTKVVRTVEETIEQLCKLSLPAAHGNILNAPASNPEQSHIGGPVYLPKGVSYPRNTAGNRKMFIIQINFADFPKIEGYPETGVWQLFGEDAPNLGFYARQETAATKPTILFWHDPKILTEKYENIYVDAKTFPNSTIYLRDNHDHNDDPIGVALDVHRRGRVIQFQPELQNFIPDLEDFPADQIIKHDFGNYDQYNWNPIMNDISTTVQSLNVKSAVRIGGYPSYCQGDNRTYYTDTHGRYITRQSRVLLHLSSLDVLAIGDSGAINLTISPKNLANVDFSGVEFDIAWN